MIDPGWLKRRIPKGSGREVKSFVPYVRPDLRATAPSVRPITIELFGEDWHASRDNVAQAPEH